jgi:transcriptional regulator with XRE-family HTH domain
LLNASYSAADPEGRRLSSYEEARAALGARLRQLRKDAGLTGEQLARRFGWQQSKVSRIETGKQNASEADITAWAQAVGAASEVVEELLAGLKAVQIEYATWRQQHQAGVLAKQQALLDLEAKTTTVRAFDPVVIPGLLQTAEYARWRLIEGPELYESPDDVAAAVRARMQRQEVLYNPAKRFRFVVTEATLRYQLCPAETLRGQLDRLVAVSSLGNVVLGVIPFSIRVPLAPMHGFWIFDDQLVTVETFGGELMLREPHELDLYARAFETLQAAAVFGEQSRAIITQVLADLRQLVN